MKQIENNILLRLQQEINAAKVALHFRATSSLVLMEPQGYG